MENNPQSAVRREPDMIRMKTVKWGFPTWLWGYCESAKNLDRGMI